MAAKIASSGKQVQVAAALGTGMLSLLSSDPSVRRVEDLREKTVEVAGQGATPDYVFRRILLSKGLNTDRDLRFSYVLAYPEIAQSLIAGRVSNALLPEPFATMARSAVVSAAIPRSNYVFIPAAEAQPALEDLFRAFLEFAPASIGGALPGDWFYLTLRP